MSPRPPNAVIRTLRPITPTWPESDIARWLNPSTATAPASPIGKPATEPLPSHDVPPAHRPTRVASDPVTSSQLDTITLAAAALLRRCETPTHDPLSGWSLDTQTLQVLLIQCPIIGSGTDPESLRIIGDINIAAAILSRLPADYPVTVMLYDSPTALLDRLDFILRAPTSTEAIERELSRHTHLLPTGTLRDSDLAAYLGVSEAAIRKARSRRGHRR